MNESGRSIAAAARFYKVEPAESCSSSTTTSTSSWAVCRRAPAAASPAQRASLDRPGARYAGLPPPADRGRPARAGRPARSVADSSLAVRAARAIVEGLVARAADAVEVARRRRSRGSAAPVQLTSVTAAAVATARAVSRVGRGRRGPGRALGVLPAARLVALVTHTQRISASVQEGTRECPWGSLDRDRPRAPLAATITPRDAVPASRMDQAHLRSPGSSRRSPTSERFAAFAADFPANARVSEPLLALVLATLHRSLDRSLVCLLAEDEEARDVAEAVGWYGEPARSHCSRAAVFTPDPARAPAHLVGERSRALEVSGAAGSSASRRARSPRASRPRETEPRRRPRVALAGGLDALVEKLALAGYERVERVEERGQIAVRGGLVDVFPSTGREPLRIEFFGDEVEQVRAFSPFTQRTLHAVDETTVYPGARAGQATRARSPRGGRRPRPAPRPPPDLVWQLDDVAVSGGGGARRARRRGPARLDALPRSQPHAFEAQRPAIAARGLAEAENELAAWSGRDAA